MEAGGGGGYAVNGAAIPAPIINPQNLPVQRGFGASPTLERYGASMYSGTVGTWWVTIVGLDVALPIRRFSLACLFIAGYSMNMIVGEGAAVPINMSGPLDPAAPLRIVMPGVVPGEEDVEFIMRYHPADAGGAEIITWGTRCPEESVYRLRIAQLTTPATDQIKNFGTEQLFGAPVPRP